MKLNLTKQRFPFAGSSFKAAPRPGFVQLEVSMDICVKKKKKEEKKDRNKTHRVSLTPGKYNALSGGLSFSSIPSCRA